LDTFFVSVVPIHHRVSSEDLDDAIGQEVFVHVGIDPSGGSIELNVQLYPPDGFKLNSEAPNSWSVSFPGMDWSLESGNGVDRGNVTNTNFVVVMKRGRHEAEASEVVKVRFNLYLCSEDSGVCTVAKKSVDLLVASSIGKNSETKLVRLDLSKS
jgi:hypothetical protein